VSNVLTRIENNGVSRSMTMCCQQGMKAEQRFEVHATSREWTLFHASQQQDINEHWDWQMVRGEETQFVDVKARKRISRHDTSVQDEWVWIELHSVRPDNRGWLYDSKATLIAFEIAEGFVIVPRLQLLARVQKYVSSRRVFQARDARYCIYQRQGRYDQITMIEMKHLTSIAWNVWIGV
jgi:hypothetical protein